MNIVNGLPVTALEFENGIKSLDINVTKDIIYIAQRDGLINNGKVPIHPFWIFTSVLAEKLGTSEQAINICWAYLQAMMMLIETQPQQMYDIEYNYYLATKEMSIIVGSMFDFKNIWSLATDKICKVVSELY